MFRRGKYVVGKFRGNRWDSAVIFDESANHSDFRDIFETIEGAGFFTISTADDLYEVVVRNYGESVSLKIKSRPEDLVPLQKALGIYDSPF